MQRIRNLHIFKAVIEIDVYLTGSDYRSLQIETTVGVGNREWSQRVIVKTGYKYFTLPSSPQCVSQWTIFNAGTRTHSMGFYPPIQDDLNSFISIGILGLDRSFQIAEDLYYRLFSTRTL